MRYRCLPFIWLLLLQACTDPVAPVFKPIDSAYLVEGNIVDQPGESRVNVFRTRVVNEVFTLLPVREALVSSVTDGGQATEWSYRPEAEAYEPPADFRAEPGRSYSVRVLVEDREIVSVAEPTPRPVPIERVGFRFDQRAEYSLGFERSIPAFDLLIDFRDPPGERNFYRTSLRQWQTLAACLFCPHWSTPIGDRTQCSPANDFHFVAAYYPCATACWSWDRVPDVRVFDDAQSDGALRTNVVAGRSRYLGAGGSRLFEVDLFTLSAGNYDYRAAFDQIERAGSGLNAPIPATLVGNLRYTGANAREAVLGYVGTVSVTRKRLFVARDDFVGTPLDLRDPLIRNLNQSVDSPCVGPRRTDTPPAGWGE